MRVIFTGFKPDLWGVKAQKQPLVRPGPNAFIPSVYSDDHIEYRGTLCVSDLRSLPVFLAAEKRWVSPGMDSAFLRQFAGRGGSRDGHEPGYHAVFVPPDEKSPWKNILGQIGERLQTGDRLLYIVNTKFSPIRSLRSDGIVQTGHDTFSRQSVFSEIIKVLVVDRQGKRSKIAFNDAESTTQRNYNVFDGFFVMDETDHRWQETVFSLYTKALGQEASRPEDQHIRQAFVLYQGQKLDWLTFSARQQAGDFPLASYCDSIFLRRDGRGSWVNRERATISELLAADRRIADFKFPALGAKLLPGDRILGLSADIFTDRPKEQGGTALVIRAAEGELSAKSARRDAELTFFVEREGEVLRLIFSLRG